MDDNIFSSIDDRLNLMLIKYEINKSDYVNNDNNSNNINDNINDDKNKDESESVKINILLKENEHYKNKIKIQNELIDILKIKHQDLAIEYNTKIERLREQHQQEIAKMHDQFRMQLYNYKRSNKVLTK